MCLTILVWVQNKMKSDIMFFRIKLNVSFSNSHHNSAYSHTEHLYIYTKSNMVCNHVIAVYSENKLQHYATAYRNHKSAGEKLCLVSN